MNTPELVDAVAATVNMANKDVKRVIDSIVNVIQSEMGAGGVVLIQNLGKFYRSSQGRKRLRNPKTQAVIIVPAKKVVKFTAAKLLKDSV
jgi:DNA-binding protein HU-beta